MQRNGVGGKSIQDDQPVSLIGGVSQGEPRIPQDEMDFGSGITQEGEKTLIAGNADDAGINLVIGNLLTWLPVGGQGAGAEADNRNAFFGISPLIGIKDLPDRPGAMIVEQGLVPLLRVQALPAMDRVAMNELAKPSG